jgi:hypothetical protein
LIERVTNRTRYAVDVTSGGRSSAMSRKDVGDDLCHLEPLPRFDFRPVIANGSFTSEPDGRNAQIAAIRRGLGERIRSTQSGSFRPA